MKKIIEKIFGQENILRTIYILIFLTFLFWGLSFLFQNLPIMYYHSANVEYNSNSSKKELATPKEIIVKDRYRPTDRYKRNLELNVKFKVNKLTQYANIFGTSDENNGIRFEFHDNGNNYILIGDSARKPAYEEFLLDRNLADGKFHTLKIIQKEGKNCKVFIDGKLWKTFPEFERFKTDKITVGKGYNDSRILNGEITNFELKCFVRKDIKEVVQICNYLTILTILILILTLKRFIYYKKSKEFSIIDKDGFNLYSLGIIIFSVYTISFFMPLDFLLTNFVELNIKKNEVILYLLTLSTYIFAIISFITLILPTKIKKILTLILFAIAFFCNFEFLFIMPHIGMLKGQLYSISNYIGLIFVEVLFMLAVIFALVKSKKSVNFFKNIFIFCLIILISNVSIFLYKTLNFNSNTHGDSHNILTHQKFGIDYKDYNVYSKRKNIVIIMADSFSRGFFEDFMKLHPEFNQTFKDFEHYQNFYSKGHSTMYALPAIFTSKYPNHNMKVQSLDEKHYEFLHQAFNSDTNLLKKLKKKGYNNYIYPWVTLFYYLDPSFIDNLVLKQVNCIPKQNYKNLVKNIVFLQNLPIVFKEKPYNYMTNLTLNKQTSTAGKIYDDLDFYNFFEKGMISKNIPSEFKFYHLRGLHSPFVLDENLNKCDFTKLEGDYLEIAALANFKMIKNYLNKMKESGLYDNTAIIIMGDHGIWYNISPLENSTLIGNPLFLYKGFDQKQNKMTKNNMYFDVSDIQSLILNLTNEKQSKWTIPQSKQKEYSELMKKEHVKVKIKENFITPSKGNIKFDSVEKRWGETSFCTKSGMKIKWTIALRIDDPNENPLYSYVVFNNIKDNNPSYYFKVKCPKKIYMNKFYIVRPVYLFDLSSLKEGSYKINIYTECKDKKYVKYYSDLKMDIKNNKIKLTKGYS